MCVALHACVSMSYCNELMSVEMDLLQKNVGLLCSAVLQNTLDNSASIGMCSHRIHLDGYNHFGMDSKIADTESLVVYT